MSVVPGASAGASAQARPPPSVPTPATTPAALFALDDAACLRHAERSGTPCFVYRGAVARERFASLRSALPPRVRIAYAVKANPYPELLRCFASLGSSFDVASEGELRRVEALGVPGTRVFFAGPGKQTRELAAALRLGARVQAEGWEDLERLDDWAGRQRPLANGPVAVNLRVHPLQAAAEEAPLIGGSGPSAFGVDEEDLPALLARADLLRHVRIAGLHVFAASNQRDERSLLRAYDYAFTIGERLQREHGVSLEQIDLGGGLGVPYAAGESALDIEALGRGLQALLDAQRWFTGDVILEPGRWLAAPCGVYLVRVLRLKHSRGRRFAILEAGINHLLRPLLTGQPFPVRRVGTGASLDAARLAEPDEAIVLAGPLCTSLDRLGEVRLPARLAAGDLLAFGMTGAYGFTEAMPGFLSHPAATEVWED